MNLSKHETIEKSAEQCGHCKRNTILPYEYEFTCVSCGYNVIKRKQKSPKFKEKKIKFKNRLMYAGQKVFLCLHRSISIIWR